MKLKVDLVLVQKNKLEYTLKLIIKNNLIK